MGEELKREVNEARELLNALVKKLETIEKQYGAYVRLEYQPERHNSLYFPVTAKALKEYKLIVTKTEIF